MINRLLRPHWTTLGIAFIAVIIQSLADLFEPWPIKIVLDYAMGSHLLPAWLDGFVRAIFGGGQIAVVNFAAMAAVMAAVVGAVASYTQNYLTTKVGQWVMHDLRQILYHHIQRLSLSFYDRTRIGDLISRVTDDVDAIQSFISSALLGMVVDQGTHRQLLARNALYTRLYRDQFRIQEEAHREWEISAD